MNPPQSPLLWNAPVWDVSGYAEDARNLIFAARTAGISQQLRPIPWKNLAAQLDSDTESQLRGLEKTPLTAKPIHIHHFFPPYFSKVSEAVCNIGRTTFETDRIPADWVAKCNEMDQIWVPSKFNQESFLRAGVKTEKIQVLPEAIDAELYRSEAEPFPFREGLGFVFLSTFVLQQRKGWDLLLRAYCKEFKGSENVALVLKLFIMTAKTREEIEQSVSDFIREKIGIDPDQGPKVFIQWDSFPSHEMPRLYRSADCFVMPTRGEGWGRPFMEAMACGVPTIGTRWSGHLDYMNDENSFLVNSKLVRVSEEAAVESPHYRDHQWAEPDVDHLRELMRRVFRDRSAAKKIAARGREDVLSLYSREKLGQEIASYCRLLGR